MNAALPLLIDSSAGGSDPCAGIKKELMRGLQSGQNEKSTQGIL